jgi:2-haloacid dehalogenase
MTVADWGRFAQEWRDTYKVFTKSRANNSTLPMKTVDQHHFDALQELLASWKLEDLWSAEELLDISLIWHRLDPWVDSGKGIEAFNGLGWTCTLSNGNTSLLQELQTYAKLSFTHLFSAEDFGTFKPNKAVYLGAAEKLGIAPSQCFMVAAHLADLKAAKECGYRTIYIERPLEEDWDVQQVGDAKKAGFVDLWVPGEEDGFIAAVNRLKDSGIF